MEMKKMEKMRDGGKFNEGWKKHVEMIGESTVLRDGIRKASC